MASCKRLVINWIYYMKNTHLNHASLLPPTHTPLLIEVAGQIVAAQRTTHVRKRGDELEYVTDQGFTIHGRYRWTYP